MKVVAIKGINNPNYTNTIWLVSTTKVIAPNFTDIAYMALTHSNDDDLKRIFQLINDAEDRSQLIDPVNFYELCLGNPENADILILGNNPGAKGIDTPKTPAKIKALLIELEQRKDCRDRGLFFPLSSPDALMQRPWFPVRLIFGRAFRVFPRNNNEPRNGILSRFINQITDACQYADKICSLDLVPYHTVDFAYGQNLVRKFGRDMILRTYIRNAMAQGKIILALYGSALDNWCKSFPDLKLEQYPYVYTTHRSLADEKAGKGTEQSGSMHIDRLRHYSKIGTTRTPDENCEPLFNRLVELGWTRIIQ